MCAIRGGLRLSYILERRDADAQYSLEIISALRSRDGGVTRIEEFF